MEQIKKCMYLLDKISICSSRIGISLEIFNISIDEIYIMQNLYNKLLDSISSGEKITCTKVKTDKLSSYCRYYNNIYEQYLLIEEFLLLLEKYKNT